LRHNVLNGLNIILGNVDLLEAQLDDTDTSQLETIRNRGEELTRFTEATKASMENFLAPSIHLADRSICRPRSARKSKKPASSTILPRFPWKSPMRYILRGTTS
jgi:hypothetical protein